MFRDKYLKYKNKYLNLKKQIAGSGLSDETKLEILSDVEESKSEDITTTTNSGTIKIMDGLELRLFNSKILNKMIRKELARPVYHIFDYSLIDKEITKNQLRENKLFLVSSHGSIITDDDIILKPGQRIISMKYFTIYYELAIVIQRFILKLFREWPEFDKLSFLSELAKIKIGDQRIDNIFYRKYGIYDGNIEQSKRLPNMNFGPLEQNDIFNYLSKPMKISILTMPRRYRNKLDLNFIANPSLYSIDGGIMEVPISFKHNITGNKLDLTKIFNDKKNRLDVNELEKHRKLFANSEDKLVLNANSEILKNNYTSSQFYISPHDFTEGITLKKLISDLEERGINQFTIFIITCKKADDIKLTRRYKYFDLKEYMDNLR